MWMRTLAVLLTGALLAGCAGGSMAANPEPEPLDLTGAYTLTTSFQGSTVRGRMQLTGEPGSYSGSIYTGLTGAMTMRAIEADGNQFAFTADSPDGPIYITLTFDRGTFTGSWSLGADGAPIRGQRIDG